MNHSTDPAAPPHDRLVPTVDDLRDVDRWSGHWPPMTAFLAAQADHIAQADTDRAIRRRIADLARRIAVHLRGQLVAAVLAAGIRCDAPADTRRSDYRRQRPAYRSHTEPDASAMRAGPSALVWTA